MEEDFYLVNFDENKPYVSVSMPIEIEKASACKRTTYRAVLGAGIIEEINTNEEINIQFSKNIEVADIQNEIMNFFHNFFSMLERIKKDTNDFPLYTENPWKAEIKPSESSSTTIIEENYYSMFKARILELLPARPEPKNIIMLFSSK